MSPSILVLGAGPAGAACALFLARRGFGVTVLEARQADSSAGIAVDSASHRRQGHSFLALATRILQEECPDIVRELVESGARKVSLAHARDHWNLLARRTLLDAVFCQALIRESGVRVVFGNRATGLMLDFASANDPPRVFGVTTPEGPVTADLVVDAAGWRSPVQRWLAEKQIQVGVRNDPTSFFYVTRHYRLRAGAVFPSTRVPVIAMLDCITAIAFAEDNGHFQLTLQLDVRDPLKRHCLDPVLFERGLAEIPEMAPWVSAGEPIGDPEPVYSVGNCFKQLVAGKPLVRGLLLLGDAAVHTNPSASRGIAMALTHARELANLLARQPPSVNGAAALTEQWEEITSRQALDWLDSQIRVDRRRRRQVRAALTGDADVADNDPVDRLSDVLTTPRDQEIGRAAERIFNMLITPADLLRDRSMMKRVLRESRAGIATRPYSGPKRAEFERLMTRT